MNLPDVVTRQEWLEARRRLLAEEKELTRRRDALNAQRRQLPMVRIEAPYRFSGPDGTASLLDLFGGCRQLVLQHVMFDPSWDSACPACTAAVNEIGPGFLGHLQARDTSFVLVSRAPIEKLEAYRRAQGWDLPWYSSFASSFNYDFGVSLDPAVAPVSYNYRGPGELEAAGLGWLLDEPSEQPGMSCFLRQGDEIFHTYSTFARGMEQTDSAYQVLDLTALGRQEDWEEPKGRVAAPRGAVPTFT